MLINTIRVDLPEHFQNKKVLRQSASVRTDATVVSLCFTASLFPKSDAAKVTWRNVYTVDSGINAAAKTKISEYIDQFSYLFIHIILLVITAW